MSDNENEAKQDQPCIACKMLKAFNFIEKEVDDGKTKAEGLKLIKDGFQAAYKMGRQRGITAGITAERERNKAVKEE